MLVLLLIVVLIILSVMFGGFQKGTKSGSLGAGLGRGQVLADPQHPAVAAVRYRVGPVVAAALGPD